MDRSSDDRQPITPVDERAARPDADASASEAEIRRRAYERYLSRGESPGSEVDDWYAAEREVREAGATRADTVGSRPTTDSSTASGPDGEPILAPRGHGADVHRAARTTDPDPAAGR